MNSRLKTGKCIPYSVSIDSSRRRCNEHIFGFVCLTSFAFRNCPSIIVCDSDFWPHLPPHGNGFETQSVQPGHSMHLF